MIVKKRLWTVRALAFGAALAFVTATGVGVQAREPESLTEVTEISASAFQALKPEGPVTAEEKRTVIKNVLSQSGLPESLAENLNDKAVDSLYSSPGFEMRIEYFKENDAGELEQIPYEQKKRIDEYNDRREKVLMSDTIGNASRSLMSEGASISHEINNLTHGLIVGGPVDGQRLCWAFAIWDVSPVNRWVDFLGITSSQATILNDTALAGISYDIQMPDGHLVDYSKQYSFNSTDFTESGCGVGKEFDIPNDQISYNSSTQMLELCHCVNLQMSVAAWSEESHGACNIVSDYYHKTIGLTIGMSISGDSAGFSITPTYAFSHSDVSETLR